MARRRASYSACASFIAPKFPVGCWSAFSSTCASVMEVDPTVATTSLGAGVRGCCADDCAHPVSHNAAMHAAPVAAKRCFNILTSVFFTR